MSPPGRRRTTSWSSASPASWRCPADRAISSPRARSRSWPGRPRRANPWRRSWPGWPNGRTVSDVRFARRGSGGRFVTDSAVKAPAKSPIVFGTDGWRARIAEDYTFENVRRCADGVAHYVIEQGEQAKGVVIAYDRRFASEHFAAATAEVILRSEEHTSELQSLAYLVCRLLLEKKNIM